MLSEYRMAYQQIRNSYERFPAFEQESPGLLQSLEALKPCYPVSVDSIPARTAEPIYQAGQWPIAHDVMLNVTAKLQVFKFYEAVLNFLMGHLDYYPEYYQWSETLRARKRQAYYQEIQRLGELKNKAAQHIHATRSRPQDCLYFNDDFYPLELPLTSAPCPLNPQLRELSPSGTQPLPNLGLAAIA